MNDAKSEALGGARFVGVDGRRGGWVAVELIEGGGWSAAVHSSVAELWHSHRETELILIDMPIGLPDGAAPRLCDQEARRMLKPGRASSIFPAPVRRVLNASDYGEANALQRQESGRGLSRQSWNLTGKIRELDAPLQRDGLARERLRESHPELIFAKLFGGPMAHGKKTTAGFRERMAHLGRLFPEAETLVRRTLVAYRRSILARDDIVDALALAVCGLRSGGRLHRVPDINVHDSTGLPCAIWYYDLAATGAD
ncbi:DUF429 domain-containing protein [Paenibacillus sp. P25]|nr:DUF429 domain-containing protein [Paenibacillus sp. P25]